MLKRTVIATGTVTYAMKGRDLLRKKGYKADVQRTKYGLADYGCGYGIVTDCPPDRAEAWLKSGHVKVLRVTQTE